MLDSNVYPTSVTYVGEQFLVAAVPWREELGPTSPGDGYWSTYYWRHLPVDAFIVWQASGGDYSILGESFRFRRSDDGRFDLRANSDGVVALGRRIAAVLSSRPSDLGRMEAADVLIYQARCAEPDGRSVQALCRAAKKAHRIEDIARLAAGWVTAKPPPDQAAWILGSQFVCSWPPLLVRVFVKLSHDKILNDRIRSFALAPHCSPAPADFLQPQMAVADEGAYPSAAAESDAAQKLLAMEDGSGLTIDLPYVAMNDFSYRCVYGCLTELRSLSRSRSAMVRVGAALFRLIRGDRTALPELRALAKARTLAGAWAAVALARRGDNVAATHAADVLEEMADSGDHLGGFMIVFHFLRSEFVALLDNSIWRSNVRLPRSLLAKNALNFLTGIWRRDQNRITLSDPWLPLFDAVHLDD